MKRTTLYEPSSILSASIRCFLLFFLFIVTCPTARAQSNINVKVIPTDVSIVTDPDKHKISIEVKQGTEISNLLVLVVNDTGHTVFMDDQSHFKGVYKNEVDLTHEGKGEYSLKIIADKEEINKKVVIR